MLKEFRQIEEILAIPAEDAIQASGKSGIGEKYSRPLNRLPGPRWTEHPKSRALVFDSQYDPFKGVICYIRAFSGNFEKNAGLVLMSDERKLKLRKSASCLQPVPVDSLGNGEVGYIVTGIRDVADIKIGDTLTVEITLPLRCFRI